ncbi:MAG: SIMPL domain-containing protein [bacterium]|nr:SIMPL domain-containing protein [bacterium]
MICTLKSNIHKYASLVTCLVLVSFATIAHAQQVDLRRMVTVEGEAEAFFAPDRASVELGVETEGKDAEDVKADNDKVMRKLIAELKKAGIDQLDIQTSMVALQPIYNWKPDGQREFVKFQMRNTLHVTVKDLAKLDAVMGVSIDVGGNILQNINFTLSTAKTVRDDLRVQAARDAKRKAEALAAAVGARAGKPLTIIANEYYPQPMMQREMMMSKNQMADEGGPTVATGQLHMRVTVNATFELE